MTRPTTIECPACGQHYSLELGDREIDIHCEKCGADFTACKEADAPATPQATERLHRTGPRRPSAASRILDRFIRLQFRFGKWFAGVLAMLFSLGILVSLGVFLLNLGTSLDVPSYRDLTKSGSESSTDFGGLDERREIEKDFGDRVAALVKSHRLEEAAYDGLLSILADVEEDHRDAFLEGLADALNDRERAEAKDRHDVPDTGELIMKYAIAFSRAESRAEGEAMESRTTRLTALGAATTSSFMLFMMLIIPALLKIEENTRRG